MTDEFEISEIFNSYFKEVAFNIANKIPKTHDFNHFLVKSDPCQAKMDFKNTDSSKTFKIIKSLSNKNSAGFDGISSNLIKKCSLVLCNPLTQLINQSFQDSAFPNELKIGKLTPLHKRNERTNIPNCSLLQSSESFCLAFI